MPNHYADDQVLTDAEVTSVLPKWSLVQGRIHLLVRFVDFRRAASFVAKIGEMAEDANHHPEIDIRMNRVHLALNTHAVNAITGRDVKLASAIVPVIKVFGGELDPGIFSETQITIDTADADAIRPFWAAVYGYQEGDHGWLLDPTKSGPRVWFQIAESTPPTRNRLHVDLVVPADQAAARVAAGIAAGGRLVTDSHAPAWWVLADAQGNEVCICTWQPQRRHAVAS